MMPRSTFQLPRRRDPTRRRTLLRSLLAAAAALAALIAPSAALAQDYPIRPVKLIVPFDAGGPADVFARFLAQRLQETMGQPFVVEDRPGAGSLIGTEAVAKSAPDGYTLLVMSNTHTVNESLVPGKPFALMKDFVPVAPINYSDLVLVVNPNVPVDNLADFIKLAKSKPNGLNYASSGTGTPYHMAGELFKAMAGVEIVHVPYKGSGGARTGVLGGQVEMMFDAVTTMSENVKAGKVKALGTTGKTRSVVLPAVPTVAEAGVAGYEAVIWLGVMAPKGTPAPIVNRLNAEITKIAGNPDVRAEWAKRGAVPMTMTPDEFGRFLNEDIAKWERIVKISGAKPDQ
jgi:tripartite-type tricarboxylate transporter receptor subunit TctC